MNRLDILSDTFMALYKELGRKPSQQEVLEKIRGRKNP